MSEQSKDVKLMPLLKRYFHMVQLNKYTQNEIVALEQVLSPILGEEMKDGFNPDEVSLEQVGLGSEDVENMKKDFEKPTVHHKGKTNVKRLPEVLERPA